MFLLQGAQMGPYKERFCQSFQTTANEDGICYTYNNHEVSIEQTENGKTPSAGLKTIPHCFKT